MTHPDLPKTQKTFRLKTGHGPFATCSDVQVNCVEQRGKFYASMNTLNASAIGVGGTAAEAFAAWAKKCGDPAEVEHAAPELKTTVSARRRP